MIMAIKPPGWCSHAIPGANGWTDPNTGEVYASARFTQAQIDEFYGNTTVDQAIHDDIQNGKIEAMMADATPYEFGEVETDLPIDDLESMTKVELEELGREHGVELDRRKSKKSLVEAMREILPK
jgi:uncharacterized membrane protein